MWKNEEQQQTKCLPAGLPNSHLVSAKHSNEKDI